jgi:glycosyltransferase involved in cell wall biosynthesis
VPRRVALYCPDLPPVPGGVADHTLVLARALAARGLDVEVLGRRGDPAVFDPLPCRTGVTPRTLPAAAIAAGAGALVVQYVPFLFARFGLAPSLVRALGHVRGAGIRIGVLVHEPYVPFSRLPWLLTGWPMRWQLRALLARADAVWSPVPDFLERVRCVARPGTTLAVAPVGATVPVESATREEARAELHLAPDVVAIGAFSPGASGALTPWVRAAIAALAAEPRLVWVIFGQGSASVSPPPGASPAGPQEANRVVNLGWLESGKLGRVFRALDLAVAPFADGLTLRRTSAMAALAYGVPLVSSRGPLFDPSLADAAACEPTAEAFVATVRAMVADPARRALLGAAGRRFYECRGSADVLAARVAADLGLA